MVWQVQRDLPHGLTWCVRYDATKPVSEWTRNLTEDAHLSIDFVKAVRNQSIFSAMPEFSTLCGLECYLNDNAPKPFQRWGRINHDTGATTYLNNNRIRPCAACIAALVMKES